MAERTFYVNRNTGARVIHVGPARILRLSTRKAVTGSFSIYDADRTDDTSALVLECDPPGTGSEAVNIPVWQGIMINETITGGGTNVVYEDDPDLDYGDRGYGGAQIIE